MYGKSCGYDSLSYYFRNIKGKLVGKVKADLSNGSSVLAFVSPSTAFSFLAVSKPDGRRAGMPTLFRSHSG